MSERPTARTPLRAELYLRGDAHGVFDVQRQVLNRVERLEANGTLGESIVAGDWQPVRARAEDARSDALSTYEEFRAWARHNGHSLEPAFQRRTRTHLATDRTDEVVVFPVVALALYDERDLQAVFPCTDEDRTYTVEDALDAFERGDEGWLTQFDGVTVDRTEPALEPDEPPAISP